MLFEEKRAINVYKIDYSRQAVYITMRDGIKIAADIHFGNIAQKQKYPTILVQTRYWRRQVMRKPFGFLVKRTMRRIKEFVSYGFIVVNVDVRGTGASFGSRPYPWSDEEIADIPELAEWIVKQPWSDGNIVTYGISYSGTTSELSSSIDHPGFKGHVFAHNEYDLYLDIAYPGGIYNEKLVSTWANYNENLDNNSLKGLNNASLLKLIVKSVAPTDADISGEQLSLAIQDHQNNFKVHEAGSNASFRDDHFGKNQGSTIGDFSVYQHTDQICKQNRPLLCFGSWYDGGTAHNVINRFLNYTNPMGVIIGSWDHHFETNGDPTLSSRQTRPSMKEIRKEIVQFMKDRCKNLPFESRFIQYLTVGEDVWKITEVWPPEGFENQSWFFNEANQLSCVKSINAEGHDRYEINYTTTTGKITRWSTEVGGAVQYENRSKEDQKLLTYTSSPLENDVEITGYPSVSFWLSSSHGDGAIFVYLEHISPDGYVYYVTEGQIRLIHHKTTKGPLLYKTLAIPHSFTQQEKEQLTPDELYNVEFSLNPISILIPQGHRLRIAIAGADKDNFKRYPETDNPEMKFYRNKNHASFIILPIKKR
jgi:hypothetical protein